MPTFEIGLVFNFPDHNLALIYLLTLGQHNLTSDFKAIDHIFGSKTFPNHNFSVHRSLDSKTITKSNSM